MEKKNGKGKEYKWEGKSIFIDENLIGEKKKI